MSQDTKHLEITLETQVESVNLADEDYIDRSDIGELR